MELYADDFLALTEDHSLYCGYAEARRIERRGGSGASNRNMLTNALGIWDSVRIDINKIKNDYKSAADLQ